jgi:hypothetical protein
MPGGAGPFYLINGSTGDGNGQLQDGGSAPANQTMAGGWTVGTTVAARFSEFLFGTKRATGTFGTTALPSGVTTTATDEFGGSGGWYAGSYPAGNWTIAISVIGSTATMSGTGNLRCRVWAISDPTGFGYDGIKARELTTSTLALSSASNLTTAAAQNTTVTWAAPAITLFGEYLFFQLAWDITVASAGGTAGVVLRQDGTNSKITPTTFVPATYFPVDTVASSFTATNNTIGTLSQAINAGDTIVVYILIDDSTSTISSVTDGTNTYTRVLNAIPGESATLRTSCYVATNVAAAGAGTLTVSFVMSSTTLSEAVAVVYRGPSPTNVGATATGSTTGGVTSTTATTSTSLAVPANSFVCVFATMANGTGQPNPGDGWTPRSNTAANTFVFDQLYTSKSTITPKATQTSAAEWQMLAVVLQPQTSLRAVQAPWASDVFTTTNATPNHSVALDYVVPAGAVGSVQVTAVARNTTTGVGAVIQTTALFANALGTLTVTQLGTPSRSWPASPSRSRSRLRARRSRSASPALSRPTSNGWSMRSTTSIDPAA